MEELSKNLREAVEEFERVLENAEEYMREEVLEEVRGSGLRLIKAVREL